MLLPLISVVVISAPQNDRRKFMLMAHDLGMVDGDYVFYTIDMLPDEDSITSINVWSSTDGRNTAARKAFEAVFNVSNGIHGWFFFGGGGGG